MKHEVIGWLYIVLIIVWLCLNLDLCKITSFLSNLFLT